MNHILSIPSVASYHPNLPPWYVQAYNLGAWIDSGAPYNSNDVPEAQKSVDVLWSKLGPSQMSNYGPLITHWWLPNNGFGQWSYCWSIVQKIGSITSKKHLSCWPDLTLLEANIQAGNVLNLGQLQQLLQNTNAIHLMDQVALINAGLANLEIQLNSS